MELLTLIVASGAVAIVIAWIKFVKQGPTFNGNVSLEGKTVLITGGSYGIGKETALQLAKSGARVIIASRNEQKAAETIFDIRSITGNKMAHFMTLDLSDFSNVRAFVREFMCTEPRLDILVNNAGVVKRGVTADGNDIILATNHLGPFLLTNLLMPLLKKTANINPVRIVNVSADAYHAGKINLENLNLGLDNSCHVTQTIKQYCNTKLMNVYFTSELHRRLCAEDPHATNRISTFSLHPGIISSDLGSDFVNQNKIFRLGKKVINILAMRSAFYGCQTILYCCLESGLESKSGCYFSNLCQRKLAPHASDANVAEKLWELSAKMTNL